MTTMQATVFHGVNDIRAARYGFQIIGRTEHCRQQFYAITAERKLTHPAVQAITFQAKTLLSG